MSSDVVLKAMLFATEAHIGHKRKYTSDPYIIHPAEVAAIVHAFGGSRYQVAAAWCHDVMEDCGKTVLDVEAATHEITSEYVFHLTDQYTDKKFGNRAIRKHLEADRLALCDAEVQDIKCADLISNTRNIAVHDPNFAVVYLQEKLYILERLTKASSGILQMAWKTWKEADTHIRSLKAPDSGT